MENKDYPELQPPEELTPEVSASEEEKTEFVDYFADILPDPPVQDPPAAPEEPASSPAVTADTALLNEIQSAVERIISEQTAQASNNSEPDTVETTPEEVPAEPTPVLNPQPAADDEASDTDNDQERSDETPLSAPEELLPSEEAPQADPIEDAFGDNESFEEMFNAKAPESPVPIFDRPARKGRPKRRKGEFLFGIPQIAVTCVWLAIILVTGLTLGRMLWVCAADVLAFGREDKMVTVTVYESDTMEDIIDKLYDAGLVRYPGLFKLYADLAVDEGEIKPGIWDLNTMYDYHALVNMMSPSSSRTVVEDVLIPEGFTCRQIFDLLEENRVCTAKDLAEYAASGELKDYWFLEGLERGYEYCLEGFLFPDTYDFYKNSTPRDVLEKLLDNFEYRFNEEMQGQIETLNATVTQGTFDIHKVVIVASMIEKETANNEESPKIASVIYNRLFNWGGTPAYLNIDASIVYALDGKTDLTAEDLKVESPYNTYTHTGLTPGAISNPGLASLKAALNPETTNYYYYVLNPAEGQHKFSNSLDEHNAFIASLE